MGLLLALYEICEDIKIHALVNIMPTKGDITRGKQKILFDYSFKRINFFLTLYSNISQIYE